MILPLAKRSIGQGVLLRMSDVGQPGGSPAGANKQNRFDIYPNSTLMFDGDGNPYCVPIEGQVDGFPLLPAAALATGKDPMILSLGTGTEVIARANKGGVNIKTQVTSPAASDNVMLVPTSGTIYTVPLTAATLARLKTRINLTQISDPTSDATLVTSAIAAFAGFNETLTHVDPTTDAGDGAGFLYAPSPGVAGSPVALTTPHGLAQMFSPSVTAAGSGYVVGDILTVAGGTLNTGASAATVTVATVNATGGVLTATMLNPGVYTTNPTTTSNAVTGGTGTSCTITFIPSMQNWLFHQKVAGADTFIDTGVPVVAGVDYEIIVQYGPDLIPRGYLNGVLVATGATAATSTHSVGPVIGEQIMNSTPAGQLDMDVRYVEVDRQFGY